MGLAGKLDGSRKHGFGGQRFKQRKGRDLPLFLPLTHPVRAETFTDQRTLGTTWSGSCPGPWEWEAAAAWQWRCQPLVCTLHGGSLKPESSPLAVLCSKGQIRMEGALWAWFSFSVFWGTNGFFLCFVEERGLQPGNLLKSPASPNCATF